MYMIMCVIDDPELLGAVLDSWHEVGIRGVTILESSGLYRHRQRPWIPMRYGFTASGSERGNVTLVSVVENEEIIQRCLEATEKVVGDFDEPETGIFITLPIGMAKGVSGKRSYSAGQSSP